MSDTPRTDAARISAWGEGGISESLGFTAVPTEFARTLERELSAANAENEKLRQQQDELARRCVVVAHDQCDIPPHYRQSVSELIAQVRADMEKAGI